jgi:magnesium-transporting ATPase (P-type)
MSNHSEAAAPLWHNIEAEDILQQLSSSLDGLPQEDAQRRLEEHGPNRLQPARKKSPLARFLVQFHNVLIYVLIGSGCVTALLGHWLDSGVIFGVVVINAIIGYIQEGKAEKALDAIRNMLSHQSMVKRDNKFISLPADQLVPGAGRPAFIQGQGAPH